MVRRRQDCRTRGRQHRGCRGVHLTSETGLPTGQFSGTPLTGTGEIYAAYPYATSGYFTDGKFEFTIRTRQIFSSNSFANNAFPMVGKGSSMGGLQFRNLMGVLKFQVTGDKAVASLTVTTAGEATVAMNYTDAPTLVMDPSGTTSISLTDINLTLSDTPTAFYIALPAGEYAPGLKFELKDPDDNVIYAKTTTAAVTVNRSKATPLTPVDIIPSFPDAGFRAWLAKKGYVETSNKNDIDITNPTNIQKFKTTTVLFCPSEKISSMKGVELFTELTALDCNRNSLTSLDLSNHTTLTTVNFLDGQLTSINLSGCTALKEFSCGNNKLTSFNLSGCTALTNLSCPNNQLTSLVLSNNTALTNLTCSTNQLTSLDVSANTALTWLECSYNRIPQLNIVANTAITALKCNSQTTNDTTAQQITVLISAAKYDVIKAYIDKYTGFNEGITLQKQE